MTLGRKLYELSESSVEIAFPTPSVTWPVPGGKCNRLERFSQWEACTENRSALQSANGATAKLCRDGIGGNRGVGAKCLLTARVGVIAGIALRLLYLGGVYQVGCRVMRN